MTNLIIESLQERKPIVTVTLYDQPVSIKSLKANDSGTDLFIALTEPWDNYTGSTILITGDDGLFEIVELGAINNKGVYVKTENLDFNWKIIKSVSKEKVYKAYKDSDLLVTHNLRLREATVKLFEIIPKKQQLELLKSSSEGNNFSEESLMEIDPINLMMEQEKNQRITVEARFQMPEDLLKIYPTTVIEKLNNLLNDAYGEIEKVGEDELPSPK